MTLIKIEMRSWFHFLRHILHVIFFHIFSRRILEENEPDYYSGKFFSRRILEENEPDYYSGKFFFSFFFRQTTECMRSGHFLQNY